MSARHQGYKDEQGGWGPASQSLSVMEQTGISGVGCESDGKEMVWDDLLACDWLQHPHPFHLTTPSKVVYVQVGNRELTNKVRKEDQG